MKEKFEGMIYEALRKTEVRGVDIYTFALYHDHESELATVCVDTIQRSSSAVRSNNEFCQQQFFRAIEDGDIAEAMLWNSNGGRNYGLGDFAFRNLSEIDVPRRLNSPQLYLDMVGAVRTMSELISRQSQHGDRLIFFCSTENSEVGLIWPNM